MSGRVHQINVSAGGVPKSAVAEALLTTQGVAGDSQADTKHHGGPDRAVCLFSLEIIRKIAAEGHPIGLGTTGENLTIEGVDWERIVPGVRLVIGEGEGGAELEVASYTRPCATIRDSFLNLQFRRIDQDLHPGESRVYARVLREGRVRAGDSCRVLESDRGGQTGRPVRTIDDAGR